MIFSKAPAVVALAELRAGDILPVEAPAITVPKVEVGKVPKIEIPYRVIPELPLTVYRCTYAWGWWIFHAECGWAKIVIDPASVPDWFKEHIPERLKPPYQCPQRHGPGYIKKIDGTKPEEWASAMRGYSLYCAREFAGNWTLVITGDFNWLRDLVMNAIGWALAAPGDAMGRIAAQLGVENLMVQSIMNVGFKDITGTVEKRVNEGFSDVQAKVQTGLNKFRSGIQSGVNAGLSKVIPILYQMMGLAPGQLVSPINTRNVTTESFEFWSLSAGMKIHYLAGGPA